MRRHNGIRPVRGERTAEICAGRAGLASLTRFTALALASTALVPLGSEWALAQTAILTNLGTLGNPAGDPTGKSQANGLNADGSILVGQSTTPGGTINTQRAFSWTVSGGMANLGVFTGDIASNANGISGDGTTIFGQSGSHAVRWPGGGGPVQLAPLAAGQDALANRVDANVSVIVGNSNTGIFPNASGSNARARAWIQKTLLELNTAFEKAPLQKDL